MEHIINETEMEYIVVSKDKIKNILDMEAKIPQIKHIISMDQDIENLDLERSNDLGITIHTFKQVESLGETMTESSDLPLIDDIATICYTSGTTGVPKGAIITHANCVASTYGVAHTTEIGTLAQVTQYDVYISYLPMAHVFERVAQGFMLFKGCAIGYYHGDISCLMDDIEVLKPTILVSVPRLFNRIYDKTLAGVEANGVFFSYLFHMAYNAKKANLENSVEHWLYDRLVFKPIREKLGGRIRFILSGSAPIAPDVMDFLKICFSSPVHEGYGQTENYCGGSLVCLHNDLHSLLFLSNT
jgi:long-chain acyl-CoA synthetase